MIQDRAQKEKALWYVASRRWFPQLELDVSAILTTGDKPMKITDVDVSASIPSDDLGFRALLVDCKTKKNESPINRALWLKGLMERMGADRGICILKANSVEMDHRYTAAQLGVTILTEDEFDRFSAATSSRYIEAPGFVAQIALWEKFFEIGVRFKPLISALEFSRSSYWMIGDSAEACRKTLVLMRHLRLELDPARREHVVLVGDLAALFMHSLSVVVSKIFYGYLQPERREDLSTALLLLVYGGRDAYDQRNRLKKIVAESKGLQSNGTDLSLPEWDRFVQLVRQALDAPIEVAHSPLILREVAWSYLAEAGGSSFAKTLAKLSPQGARFAVLGLEYLCKAAQLPPEFSKIFGDELIAVQAV